MSLDINSIMLDCGAIALASAGIKMCKAGFSKKGITLRKGEQITGRSAKIIGVIILLVSLVLGAALIAMTFYKLPTLPTPTPPPTLNGQ
jgi:Na+/melibiose symporter-like transporter